MKNTSILKESKLALISAIAIVLLTGCSNASDEIDPLYGNDKAGQITSNITEVNDTFVTDGQKAEAIETIRQMMTDYVYRVYNVNENSVEADYIDESTTPEEWYGNVRGASMYCSITDAVIANADVDVKTDKGSGLIILTAIYKDSATEKGEYYLPIYVNFELIDEEWKVIDSECPYIASSDDYELEKDEAAGMYKLKAIRK